jgi:hypothetical protein
MRGIFSRIQTAFYNPLLSTLTPQEDDLYPKRKWVRHYFLKRPWDTGREQSNYYPLPIRITSENFEVTEQSDGTPSSS